MTNRSVSKMDLLTNEPITIHCRMIVNLILAGRRRELICSARYCVCYPVWPREISLDTDSFCQLLRACLATPDRNVYGFVLSATASVHSLSCMNLFCQPLHVGLAYQDRNVYEFVLSATACVHSLSCMNLCCQLLRAC